MRLLLQGRVPSRRDNAAVKKNGTLNEFRLQPVIGPISGFPPAERQPEFISSFFFPSALLQRKRRSPSYYKPQRRRLRTLILALATLAVVLGRSDYFAWLLLDFLARGSPECNSGAVTTQMNVPRPG